MCDGACARLAPGFASAAPCRHVAVDVRVDRRVDEGGRVTVPIAESSASVRVTELTPEEAAAAFDRVARTSLDLSGEEFLAALERGKCDGVDPDVHLGLLAVLMALPLVR
jgi:hypothetical protein